MLHYFRGVKQAIIEGNSMNNESVIYFTVGMFALGRYQLFFRFYDEIKQNIKNSPLYVEFMHIFLLMIGNPGMLYLQMKQNEAN